MTFFLDEEVEISDREVPCRKKGRPKKKKDTKKKDKEGKPVKAKKRKKIVSLLRRRSLHFNSALPSLFFSVSPSRFCSSGQ